MKKPDIPKRLAARIRGAQQAVVVARNNILFDADGLTSQLARIHEFESDPVGFANRYYPGQGADSYPVRATIEKARASVERKRNRHRGQLEALGDADKRLEDVEKMVLAEVEVMKPSSGRVPWPKALPPFEKVEMSFGRSRAKERAADAIEHQEYLAEVERDYEREMAQIDAQNALEDAAEAKRWADLSPEQQAAERRAVRPFRDALQRGDITVWDVRSAIKRG